MVPEPDGKIRRNELWAGTKQKVFPNFDSFLKILLTRPIMDF
jgi:hypothetical protein